jgi:hypothetical protein
LITHVRTTAQLYINGRTVRSHADKPYIVAEIAQASTDLAAAQQDAADAKVALEACRDHWDKSSDGFPGRQERRASRHPEARQGGQFPAATYS